MLNGTQPNAGYEEIVQRKICLKARRTKLRNPRPTELSFMTKAFQTEGEFSPAVAKRKRGRGREQQFRS